MPNNTVGTTFPKCYEITMTYCEDVSEEEFEEVHWSGKWDCVEEDLSYYGHIYGYGPHKNTELLKAMVEELKRNIKEQRLYRSSQRYFRNLQNPHG